MKQILEKSNIKSYLPFTKNKSCHVQNIMLIQNNKITEENDLADL